MRRLSADYLEEMLDTLKKVETPEKEKARKKRELMKAKMKFGLLRPMTFKKIEGEVYKRHQNPFRN